jgi:hypothetical protein
MISHAIRLDAKPSVSSFFLVSKGKDVHDGVGRLVSVDCHIARVTEGYDQLAQLWKFRERPADVGHTFQQQKLPFNHLTGTPGSFRRSRCQENRRRSKP